MDAQYRQVLALVPVNSSSSSESRYSLFTVPVLPVWDVIPFENNHIVIPVGRAGQAGSGYNPDMGLREQMESDFGKRVRRERERQGWNQEELAERMTAKGVPTYASTIAKLESSRKPRAVRLAEAAVLADLFEVSLDALLGRQAVPGDDLAFALRALRDIAFSSMWQIGGIRDALVGRFREAMAFDFSGRDQVGMQADRADNGLAEAQDALMQLTLLFPDPSERTEQ